MTFGFPSRFLKKLGIYQQIRSGQGISKHKRLWEQEAAYLQTAYGKDHQHLNSFQDKGALKEWIRKRATLSNRDIDHVIGNLFYRGYLEVRGKKEMCDIEVRKEIQDKDDGLVLLDRNKSAYDSRVIANKAIYGGTTKFRISPTGLLVGEVLSEINNANCVLKQINRYRYNLVLDTIWLIISWGVARLFFSPQIQELRRLGAIVFPYEQIYPWLAPLTVFIIWPFVNYFIRRVYLLLEGND